MTSKQRELYELLKQEITLLDLASYLSVSPKQAYNRVQTLKNLGYNVYRKDFSTGDIQFSIANYLVCNDNNNILYTLPNTNILRVIVSSDTHVGNSFQRFDLLKETYDYCVKHDIHIIFNCGDILNGLLPSKVGSVIIKDYEEQIDFFLKNYPFDSNIINFMLLGNHDKDFFNGGLNLKQILTKNRYDIKILNYEDSLIRVKNDKIRLIHPIDNTFKVFANNSKIIFRGHSHESKIKTITGQNVFCAYVPASCDMFYQEGCSYPGIYYVLLSFNDKGVINELTINYLIYIHRFIKVGEFSHKFFTNEQYDLIKYEETPKRLILK